MSRKIISIFLISIMAISPAWAITQWTLAVPTSTSDNATNWPAEVLAQWTILQTLLQNYRQGYYLIYDNSTTLTISSGELSAWNSGASASLFLQNNSSQTANASNLDTGASFNASTTYYVYAGTTSTTAAVSTIQISLNNTAPGGSGPLTYFKQLGSFTTDSSGNISQIIDNSIVSHLGVSVAESANTVYQANTDGAVDANGSITGSTSLTVSTGLSSSPNVVKCNFSAFNAGSVSCHVQVQKGYYWEASGGAGFSNVYWTPSGQ